MSGNRLANLPFSPPALLRPAMVQTMLGSSKLRCLGLKRPAATHRSIILKTDDGVRLAARISHAVNRPVATVILIHGWEGSINSTYMVTTTARLVTQAVDVIGLNLRDHGPTHHLNQGIFYATLLEEVASAIEQAIAMARTKTICLCGFSLGANFVLRLVRRWSQGSGRPRNYLHAVAISPVLNPSRATDAIDKHRLIQRYFRNKWRHSLRLKQQYFPEIYDFNDVLGLASIRLMTRALLARYSPYPDEESYFSAYAIGPRDLRGLSVPTTVITARDDPIIPSDDFDRLELGPTTQLLIHPCGGHNGFISDMRGNTWYEAYLHGLLSQMAATGAC